MCSMLDGVKANIIVSCLPQPSYESIAPTPCNSQTPEVPKCAKVFRQSSESVNNTLFDTPSQDRFSLLCRWSQDS
eukprot:733170-Amphidinium_carterae.1